MESIISITFEKTISRTFIVERYFKLKAFWIKKKSGSKWRKLSVGSRSRMKE